MTTTPIVCGRLSGAAGSHEQELLSKRLERGSKCTPELSRSDDSSSPFLATPSAPQRFSRTTISSGVHIHCVADSSATGLRRDDGETVRAHFGDRNGDSINKDLLVVALEEENDRLRCALGAERRARQLAEAETNLQSARARKYENKASALASQLADAQQKLADFEQSALSRALVQSWLETTLPQRRGSAGLSQEDYVEPYSAVFTEPELCPQRQSKSLFGAGGPMEASKDAPAPTNSGGGHEFGVCVDENTSGNLFQARQQSSDIDWSFGSAADKELLDSCGGGCNGRTSACGSGNHSVLTPYGTAGALLSPPTSCHAGYPADTTKAQASGSFSMGCTLPTWSPAVQHAYTPCGSSGSSTRLTPAWSLPLQGKKCLPLLPMLPHGDLSRASVAQTPSPVSEGHRLLRLMSDSSPLGMSVVSRVHTISTATNIWLPARAAECHSWGLESPQRGVELVSLLQQPAMSSPVKAPSTSTSGDPQQHISICSASRGPATSEQQHPHNPPPAAHLHHSHYLQPHQVLSSTLLRPCFAPERTAPARRLLAGDSALSLTGFDAFDICAGDAAGSSIQSYPSVPVVGDVQDGSEWCNIPLGSPECTPRKDAARGTS